VLTPISPLEAIKELRKARASIIQPLRMTSG
jgi:hypothetical protein